MAGFFLAQERGYFEQAGLELELQPVDEGHQIATLLAGGRLDVAFSAIQSALINAIANGADARIVAGAHRLTAQCSDTGRLWGNRRSFPHGFGRLATLKRDLAGKSVAINSLINTNAYYLDVLLDKAGLQESDIKIVQVRYSEAVAALLNGRLDAFMGNDQIAVEKIAGTSDLIRGAGLIDVLPGFQYRFVMYGKELLRSDPGAGARFLRAYLRGIADYHSGATPQFLEDFARSNGLDVSQARITCRDNHPVDGAIDDDSVTRQVEWYVKKRLCSRKVDLTQAVDRSFLDRAQKEGA
jgi:NitT/TauT family transport system substrate-binding protein